MLTFRFFLRARRLNMAMNLFGSLLLVVTFTIWTVSAETSTLSALGKKRYLKKKNIIPNPISPSVASEKAAQQLTDAQKSSKSDLTTAPAFRSSATANQQQQHQQQQNTTTTPSGDGSTAGSVEPAEMATTEPTAGSSHEQIGSAGPDKREMEGIQRALDLLREKRSQDYGWENDTHMVILAKEVSYEN